MSDEGHGARRGHDGHGAHGLTVRWSLRGADPGVAQELRDYVAGSSLARFVGMAGLRYKLWRMVESEWFEGTYVWANAEARDAFAASFRREAEDAPGSLIVGTPPELIEPFEVVAVAEGAEGFASGVARR